MVGTITVEVKTVVHVLTVLPTRTAQVGAVGHITPLANTGKSATVVTHTTTIITPAVQATGELREAPITKMVVQLVPIGRRNMPFRGVTT